MNNPLNERTERVRQLCDRLVEQHPNDPSMELLGGVIVSMFGSFEVVEEELVNLQQRIKALEQRNADS